jgi:hypothetical protein|tara:strand:+ start:802 stop:1071 length:270 start_codon:yes stop_codon:yes gene_type:complete
MKKDNINELADLIVSKIISQTQSMDELVKEIEQKSVIDSLHLDEECLTLGEIARLYTMMDICKQDEQYEKCAIIKTEIDRCKKILKKYK